MSQFATYPGVGYAPVAQAAPDARAAFIRRTYAHLAGAVAAFVGVEAFLFASGIARTILEAMPGGRGGWLLILGGFMLLGWLSRSLTAKVSSPGLQYAGLGLYVVAQAFLFVPLIAIAMAIGGADVLMSAALLTGTLFAGLSLVVLLTRKDFSFLRTFLIVGGIVALGLIVAGVIFGFDLGLAFSGGMIVLAAAAILYDTSNVLHHYPENAHVAASLELFASLALMLWYVIQLLMALRR